MTLRGEEGIVAATRRYERWLASLVMIDRAALREKHARMEEGEAAFLRASYYRWCALWPRLCPELAAAPELLAIGDVHVENFGTWRDRRGRRVWGVNDADEASVLSYANDLVRLVASARCLVEDGRLDMRPRRCAELILEGYEKSLRAGGTSFVVDAPPRWLPPPPREGSDRARRFWDRLAAWPSWGGDVPPLALRAIRATLPEPRPKLRLVRRRSGLGSLGRPRVTAIGDVQGGTFARDAKPVLPSAAGFAAGAPRRPQLAALLLGARRPRDPMLLIREGWLVRRIGPDIVRADFADLRAARHARELLRAMGAEIANMHLATPGARARVLRDLARRDGDWLHGAAARMHAALADDHRAWRRR